MTNRQKVIDALMIVMKSYKEGYEQKRTRGDIYRELTDREDCPMCNTGVLCYYCPCGGYLSDMWIACFRTENYVMQDSIPTKRQSRGRIEELLPAYRKLYALEALKQKSYLFGGVSHG